MSIATEDQTNTEKLTVAVQGMSCAACVRRVEKALGGVDGVREASVNLATEKATMVFDPAHTGPRGDEAGGRGGRVRAGRAGGQAGTRRGWHRDGASSARRYRDSAPPGQGDVRGAAGRTDTAAQRRRSDSHNRRLRRQRASDLAAGYAGPVLGRLAILRRRVVGDTPSQREHAHLDCRGHQRSLPV